MKTAREISEQYYKENPEQLEIEILRYLEYHYTKWNKEQEKNKPTQSNEFAR